MDQIPHLGAGLGFRTELKPGIFLNRDKIDFLEIIADHYIDVPSEKWKELELLKSHFTLIPHALNLSVGSAKGINEKYVEKLARLIDFISPPYWSEHICYTNSHEIDIGHLAPLPRTNETCDVIQRNVSQVQSIIQTPLILENITYHVDLPGHQYTEPEFINQILTATGCGLLLDITNLFVNAKNHKFQCTDFLDALDCSKIVQLHFVGVETHNEILIDSHTHKTSPALFDLMDDVLSRAPVKGIILERDGNYPPIEEIIAELQTARDKMMKHALR